MMVNVSSKFGTLAVDVNSNDSVFFLKERINLVLQIPSEYQQLYFEGRLLSYNSSPLDDYNIEEDDTVTLVDTRDSV
uniref:Ubiquitin-like domain-containing protein n=1 Tax=Panagrellus redivivus TaxID=6233 RepID=A0A7E4V5V4_PANRE